MKSLFLYHTNGKAVLILFFFALGVYALMILGPLASLEQIAGQKPFDMRPTGYSHADVIALITALGEQGKQTYLTRQLPLDFIYPPLFALSISGAIFWFSRGLQQMGKFYRAIATLAFIAAFADYAENIFIIQMLNAEPLPSAQLSAIASSATIIKAILTTLVSVTLLISMLHFALQKILSRI